MTVALALVAHQYDWFEGLQEFSSAHEQWEVDELFPMALIALLALTGLRARQLRHEVLRRESAERHARALARHDPLTGLANRRVVAEFLADADDRASANDCELAVLAIDLDRFKPVNDIHGHAAGDLVLREVSKRLAEVLHPDSQNLLARLGGDEFAFVIQYARGSDLPIRLAKQIVNCLAEPIAVSDTKVKIGASVGIALRTHELGDPETLLRAADLAMYGAKREGRSTFRSYEPRMDLELRLRATLEEDLRRALEHGEIVPMYQPISSLPDGEVVGFEALARWTHPERGEIGPDTFIPIAEDAGLIDRLTAVILRRACEDAKNWPAPLSLSINISPVQLKNAWLAAQLLQIITEAGFAPSRLIVEITESGLVGDYEAARQIITSLKNAGVQVALDDFGTGYSSLNHLRELQFDRIKIDRSFVKDLSNLDNGRLVKAIIGLGDTLGIAVTAEGIETQAGYDILAALGCDFGQGFLMGIPMTALDLQGTIVTRPDAVTSDRRSVAEDVRAARLTTRRVSAADGSGRRSA
ncbi:MAG: EAL domain-containing protein [Sphingomicrobium sp.]